MMRLAIVFLGCILTASAGAKQSSTQVPAARDSVLARQLGSEALAIARDLPISVSGPPSSLRSIGDFLVRRQLRAGDIAGALESAKALRLTVFPFIAIAARQREIGDTLGLLATIDASPSRMQITIDAAAGYATRGSFDRGIALVRRLSLARDVATGLRVMAYYAAASHRDLAQSLLREVDSIANADSSARGELQEVMLIRLSMGDRDAVAAFVAAAPTAADRATRLIALSDVLRDRDTSRSDSLARLAYTAANQIGDSALRARTRHTLNARIGGVIGASLVTRVQTLADEAQTIPERISALRLLARSEVMADHLTTALEIVARIEAIAPPRTVASVLVELISDNAYSARPEPGRLSVLQRAVTLADAVDRAFADSIRSQASAATVGFNPSAGAAIAAGILSPQMRERAMDAIIRREIELNVSGPLDTAEAMTRQPFADSIYALIAARQAATGLMSAALETAGRIATRRLWAVAFSEIAAASRPPGDARVPLTSLRDALTTLDPQLDFAAIETKTLPTMIALGERTTVVSWAREKTGAAGAYARLAVMGALMPCDIMRGRC